MSQLVCPAVELPVSNLLIFKHNRHFLGSPLRLNLEKMVQACLSRVVRLGSVPFFQEIALFPCGEQINLFDKLLSIPQKTIVVVSG